ncbi:MAG: hypothetical protein ACHQAX_09385 [Gammaproteobacteria bacterium]
MINDLIQRFMLKTKFVIIDFDVETSELTFLTYGSRGTFKRSLMDVSLDASLVSDLDVTQACYLGLKMAEFLQYKNEPMTPKQQAKAHRAPQGVTHQVSFDRHGHVIYVDPESDIMISQSAILIAKDDTLLRKFSPEVGYAIGLYAGKRLYAKPTAIALTSTVAVYVDNVVDLQPRR